MPMRAILSMSLSVMLNMAQELVPVVGWLLSGDIAVRYQATRDLLDNDQPRPQNRISREGWGKQYLDSRNPDGG